MIDTNVLRATGVSKKLADEWGPRFSTDLEEYGINTLLREKHFLGQILHESANLKYTEENLNYSSEALQRVFGKYFTNKTIADSYARQPERIANRVYANRMGNGDELSGDGWKTRGQGFIQLTGTNNQRAYRLWSGDKSKILDPLNSAIYYWLENDLNRYADRDETKKLTKAINGGYNGLEDRIAKTAKAERALKVA